MLVSMWLNKVDYNVLLQFAERKVLLCICTCAQWFKQLLWGPRGLLETSTVDLDAHVGNNRNLEDVIGTIRLM